MNNKLEVLAPAGDEERLNAALNYGADAVYLGRQQFGMRASPMNFDFEQLINAVKSAHAKGVKVYLTCNTLPRNNEIPFFEKFVKEAVEADVDALIVADIGLLMMIKKFAPDMEIHISTQTGIVNYVTARELYKELCLQENCLLMRLLKYGQKQIPIWILNVLCMVQCVYHSQDAVCFRSILSTVTQTEENVHSHADGVIILSKKNVRMNFFRFLKMKKERTFLTLKICA